MSETSRTVVLIDLSSIAHPIWHTSVDKDVVGQGIVARVRSLAAGQPHVAVCCDSGRSFRHDISADYKANRPAQEAGLQHQIRLARETLAGDGFPVWAAVGFEADDLIASGVRKALEDSEDRALVVTGDKDLLQLVGPRCEAMSVRDGAVSDADAVFNKYGVMPGQMLDYLSLVGDASDNVKGAKGIGPAKAKELLQKFSSLDALYASLDASGPATLGLTPAVTTTLREFRAQLPTTRQLISLRFDAPVPFDEVWRERVPAEAHTFSIDEETEMEATPTPEPATTPVAMPQAVTPPVTPATVTALAVREPDVLAPAPTEWNKQLEPRSMREMERLAKHVHDSRQFSAYGTPQAVMATILAGRELGLQSMASLRAIHIVEGRPTLSADLMRALVIRSGLAVFFRCTERTPEKATWETQRGDNPPMALTYTIAEAIAAGLVKAKSGWEKSPADMLVARASAKLARLVYPDVCFGLYLPEEMTETREAIAS